MIASSSRSRSWLMTSSAPRYAAEELQQPRLGVDVEVVGGLVEQEDVAAGEEDPRQLDPAALAAGEHADREVEAVGAEPEAGRRWRRDLGARRRSRPRGGTRPRPGCSGPRWPRSGPPPSRSGASRSAIMASSRPAAGQDVLHGGAAVEHAFDAGVLRQVAEAARAEHRCRRRPVRRPRAPAAGWSCRRRCGRRDRPCRGRGR